MPNNYNPYQASDAFNVGAYGYLGPQARSTPQVSSGGGGSDGVAAFSQLGDVWSQTLQSYMAAPQSSTAAPTSTAKTAPQPEWQNYLQNSTAQFTSAPQSAQSPGTPGNHEPPSGPSPPPTPPPLTHGPPVATPGMPDVPTRERPSAPTQPNPHPDLWSNWAWVTSKEWGSYAGYEYLNQNPAIIDQYAKEVSALASKYNIPPDQVNVDFVDWAKEYGYASPEAGRRGYDTFNYLADGTRAPWAQAADGGGPPSSNHNYHWDPGANDYVNNVTGNTWAADHPAPPPTIHFPITGGPDMFTPPPPTTGGADPQVTSQTGPAPPIGGPDGVMTPGPASTPPGTPTGGTTPSGSPTPAALNQNDILSALQQLLGPEFGFESNQLSRNMAGQAALTGGLNSGGYLESLGRAQSQLSGNQGQRLSDYLTTAKENSLNRGVQLYQIDTNKFIAQMTDETQRLGIRTNADLQKYLDSSDNALKQYGIDKNDLMSRYQAELQLEGTQYSADKGVQIAALNKAASNAIAASNVSAAVEAAKIAAETSTHNHQMDYDLGVLGINAGIYNTDVNDRYRQLYLQWLMSPNGQLGGMPPGSIPGPFPFGSP